MTGMGTTGMALLGGALIGLSAVLLLLLTGRIAGISGITHALTRRAPASEWGWRLAFLLGMMGAGALAMRAMGQAVPSPATPGWLVVAGLLVGYGTALGGGCTSGHGVCGVARLSKRSLVATVVFVAAAMLTVFLTRTLPGVLA